MKNSYWVGFEDINDINKTKINGIGLVVAAVSKDHHENHQ
jgi:hypothetical protein